MSFQKQLTCKRKKCSGQILVPLKMLEKGGKVLTIARCPRCHESYKRLLKLADKDQWLPLIGKAFFQCDVCGTPNEDNYQLAGRNYNLLHAQRVKLIIACKQCRHKRAKVVSQSLWADIMGEIEKPSEVPAPELTCPHCNAPIPEDAKVCPSCKKEVLCSKCGAPIAPKAGFCSNCGNKIGKIEVPPSAPPAERICPSCNEPYEEKSNFCPVCGQELICDKCGAPIREGALFCVNCGDGVRKGELSE